MRARVGATWYGVLACFAPTSAHTCRASAESRRKRVSRPSPNGDHAWQYVAYARRYGEYSGDHACS